MHSTTERSGRLGRHAIASLLLLVGCAEATLTPVIEGKLAPGTWGGQDAGVVVTAEGIHVHVGCTFGNIVGNVTVDAAGRFTAEGSYVLRAYPVQTGAALPAQFSGRISGNSLTLAVAVDDTVEQRVVAVGPVTVVFGRESEMLQCPICRVPGAQP